MALQGLQNYTFPLTLLGEVTINGNLNAKDIYVTGVVNGGGISTNILGEDNTWTGTNDFQQVAFYTGVLAPSSFYDMMTKLDIDNAALAYNPLPTTNSWILPPIFANAAPPELPIINPVLIQTGNASGNILIGYTDMVNIATDINVNQNITTRANTFSGVNTFSGTISADTTIVPSLLDPTLPQQAASKGYIDGKVELAGKSVIYEILTPGTYNFTDATLTGGSLANVGKVDFWLFSGACLAQASGSVVSGTIGNGNGVRGNIQLVVGTTTDPATVYTVQDTTVPSSTYLSVSNQLIAVADGACNLNGTVVPGVVGSTTMVTQQGASANGQLAVNNILAQEPILGTATTAGGCLFVIYYI